MLTAILVGVIVSAALIMLQRARLKKHKARVIHMDLDEVEDAISK